MKSIDFLIKKNPYNSTLFFAKGLGAALKQIGHKVRFLDFNQDKIYDSLQKIREKRPDITCSFSDITFSGAPFAELFQLPHLSLLVDPAIYFIHQARSSSSIITYVDKQDEEMFKELGFQHHFFLPHGADPSFLKDPKKQRIYPAVFFGSCIDYETVKASWDKKYPDHLKTVLEETSEKAFFCQDSILSLLLLTLKEKGIDPKEINLPFLHHEIDLYLRGKDRVEILRELPLPIHVWGNSDGKKGWKEYFKGYEHITVHSPISFKKSLGVMANARIVINSSIRFKAGSHERVLYGAISGATIISSASHFFQKHFSDQEILFYHPHQKKEFHEFLTSLEGTDFLHLAENVQKQVLKNHLWEERAQRIDHHLKIFNI